LPVKTLIPLELEASEESYCWENEHYVAEKIC
jgi:hypothetical protein